MAFEAGQLWFWRVKPNKKPDPVALCTLLDKGNEPADLEELSVADILKALKNRYPSIELNRKLRAGEADIPDEETAIEFVWSKRHFVFTFYGDAEKQMDRIVEVMTKQRVPCYDASYTEKYYSLKNPPRFDTRTPEEEEIDKEVNNVAEEEVAKIKASTADQSEVSRRWQMFLHTGGVNLIYQEAIRRVEARKAKDNKVRKRKRKE